MKSFHELFQTPYHTAPFSKINPEEYFNLITLEIKKTTVIINAIASNHEPPTFENTIEALEFSELSLQRLTHMFFNINNAQTNTAIQQQAQKISPLLSEFNNDILLNTLLFERIETIYLQKEQLGLTKEQQMLLHTIYKKFSRNGAALPDVEKEQLRAIDKELTILQLTFGENVLEETRKFELLVTDKNALKGLPESTVEAAKDLAKSKEKKGWMFTLNYPSYSPFMTYAENRKLRERLYKAYGKKGFHNDALDNQKIVLKIARLRHKRAHLLGYPTHAHFVLENRMAKTPEKVTEFLNQLQDMAKPVAKKEMQRLQTYAKETDGIDQLQHWDHAFYSEKLKKALFDLDDTLLKPYFQLENVIRGMFTIARKLFGLVFYPISDIDTYHPEVKTYEVKDLEGNLRAILYTDFHPRPGKHNGAWMTSYKNQYILNGNNERPHVSIVCNFTRPTPTRPSLLTFNEVTTLFHEFGHALHGMLADTTYPSLSGTNVYWDFVELPSQLMENWCYREEALTLFATHYSSGAHLPMEYIEKIKAASAFMEGIKTLRQLRFGLLDMHWHGQNPEAVTDVKKYEQEVFTPTMLYPDIAETCMSTSFSHIFQGGYAAGYYSYKWAEVLDADAFEYFLEKGIFNPEVASALKNHILSKGGTENPMELYKRFRGRDPNPKALFRRAGFIPLHPKFSPLP